MKLHRIPREGNVRIAGWELDKPIVYHIKIAQPVERVVPRLRVFFTDIHPIPNVYYAEEEPSQY